jgi:hypothetical protein
VTEEMNSPKGSVWLRLDELDDAELQALLTAATSVVADASDDPSAAEIPMMPTRVALSEVAGSLRDAGLHVDDAAVARLTDDPVASRQLTVAVLRQLAANPSMAAEIEAAYEARRGMMVIDPLTISAMALLLFVLKLKRVKLGRAEVTFFEAKEGVLKAVRGLVGG